MGNFKKFGVPWYANDNAPAVRSKVNFSSFGSPTDEQIQAVRNHQALIQFVKKNFQKGDRILLFNGEVEATFVKICSGGDMVSIQFDDGEITQKGTLIAERISISLLKDARKIVS